MSTTAQPAASAGAILCATRLRGKLNGEIAATTPIGCRMVKASFPSPAWEASIGTISPPSLRASTAAMVYVDIARATSTRAAFSGFPASALIVRAASSARVPSASGDTDEDLRALVSGQRLAHRLLRRVDRPTGFLGAAPRDARHERVVVRRTHLEPVAGLDPVAADEQLAIRHGHSHAEQSRIA